jgi:hypothetical protein
MIVASQLPVRSDSVINRFVFSALFNEMPDFLPLFIDNFLAHTDEDVALYVNIADNSPVSTDVDFGPRVRLIRGSVARGFWGPTLLEGHMECFDHAQSEFPDFEYFITIASNSLFFRRFDGELTVQVLGSSQIRAHVSWDSLPETWHWPKMANQQAVRRTLNSKWNIEKLGGGQIEGRVAHRKDWALVRSVQTDVIGLWDELQAPLEEILPATVISSIGSGRSCLIGHNLFSRAPKLGGVFVQMEDLMDQSAQPRQVCIMKRFQRDTLNPELLAVATPQGRALLELARQSLANTEAGLRFEIALRAAASWFDRGRRMAPVWDESIGGTQVFRHVGLKPTRQRFALDGTPVDLDGHYFEPSEFVLDLEFEQVSGTDFRLSCVRSDALDLIGADGGVHQAYLYLALPKERALRLHLSGQIAGVDPGVFLGLAVRQNAGRYVRISPATRQFLGNTFSAEFLYPATTDRAHLGLPMFCGQDLKFSLTVVT